MTCSYCGSRSVEGEHRCSRCGRRPGDTLTGDYALHPTNGALAAQPKRVAEILPQAPAPPPNLSRAVQTSLFPGPKVVSIANYAAPAAVPKPVKPASTRTAATPKPRRSRVPEGQASLDFLPSAPPKPRTLGTTVEAVIYCEAPVSAPLHRAVAAALDWSMVLIGYGLFLLAFRLSGGQFDLNKTNLAVFGGVLPLLAVAYGLIFAIAGTETPGMHWTELRLTTFEGFPPEVRQRVLRFVGTCVSLCTVIGMLWSLADEENLTWQDHMSRTFPTPRAAESQIFQRR